MRPPSAAATDFPALDGAVADGGVGPQAFIEGGEIDEGFEQRADLALGVLGAIETGFIGIAAADDGEHGAGAVLDDNGGALDVVRSAACLAREPAPCVVRGVGVSGHSLDLAELFLQRFLTAFLHAEVDGGGDFATAEFDPFLL